jgi:hypothetical protein
VLAQFSKDDRVRIRPVLDPEQPHQQPKDNHQNAQPDVRADALFERRGLRRDEEGQGEDCEC